MFANLAYLTGSAAFATGTLAPPISTAAYLTGSAAFAVGTLTNMILNR